MLRPPVTIPMAFVQGMVSGVQARHQPCDAFLAGAGIAPELLHQVGARVTADQYVALFRLLMEGLDDECLGFLSRPLRRGSLALVIRSAIGAATLEVAMRRIARSFRLLQDDLLLVPVHDGALAGLALHFTEASVARPTFLHELLLRIFWRLLAWLVGGQLPAAGFDFAFERPLHAASYGKVFPAPLQFECRHSAFWFDAAQLQSPVRRDEAALRAFLADAQTQVIVPRRGDDLVSARVRDHLQHTQPAWPELAATADALHMSTSTLQRRLANEGVSFQSLKDELRRDMAIVRLNTSTVPLATLAYELGFADSAAFQRAFKGWTGSAPGAYRRGGP
ncbi:AraC family transcriptional regulator [Variovorax sp. PBL-E5]|uniref:AraC family transcriptional regulator n=1 Tax=Variovorax sp. PBL-E5 TaxID=434014 RepID=UPI001318141A|nr:AraC family transcriptional regulator [Variovorax sp. PBL-E5]VTU32785.1 Virulence-regulating protein VirS [Variovorax sp. PBL-E5]